MKNSNDLEYICATFFVAWNSNRMYLEVKWWDHTLSLVSSSGALPSSLQLPNLTMSSTSIFPSVATKYVISNYCIHELIIFISLINKVTEYIIQRNITSCQSIQQRCFPLSTNPRRGVAEGTTWPDRLFLNALHSKQNQELTRLKEYILDLCVWEKWQTSIFGKTADKFLDTLFAQCIL